jgi:hypothetical protein
MRCGAAARTRLATSPTNWRAPVIAVAVVAAIALAVLVVAVVKLAGKSSSTASRAGTTVAQQSSVTGAGPTSVTSPGTAKPASVPAATTPSAAPPASAAPVTLIPVTTNAATIVTLNGTIDPQGVSTTYQFEYGLTTKYGSRAPGTPISIGSGTAVVTVSARVAYLAPRTTYHYRLIGSKAGRDLTTADATFTTR